MIWIWIRLLSNVIYLIPPSLYQNLSWEWNDQCELCHRLSINPSGSAILVLWFLPPFICCYQTRLRLLTPNWENVISDLAQGQKSVPVLPWIVFVCFCSRLQELELRWQEYYELITILIQWIRHHILIFEERKFPSSYEEIEVRKVCCCVFWVATSYSVLIQLLNELQSSLSVVRCTLSGFSVELSGLNDQLGHQHMLWSGYWTPVLTSLN